MQKIPQIYVSEKSGLKGGIQNALALLWHENANKARKIKVLHLTFNQVVRGSSPRWLTVKNSGFPSKIKGFRYLCILTNEFR